MVKRSPSPPSSSSKKIKLVDYPSSDEEDVKEESKECSFEQISHYISKFKKFDMSQHVSKITISNASSCPEDNLANIFDNIIDKAFESAKDDGMKNAKLFGMILHGSGLIDPIVIPIRDREQNSSQAILSEIDKLEISDKKFTFLHNLINVTVTVVGEPEGSGGLNSFNPKEHFDRNNNQRIEVRNEDNLCLFFAAELSRLSHDPQLKNMINKGKIKTNINPKSLFSHAQLHNIRNNIKRQKDLVLSLLKNANIDPNLPSYGIEHIKKIQEYYDETYPGLYRIVLIDDTKDTKPLFIGPMGRNFEVAIILEDQHYTALKAIAPYYKVRKYCPDCGLFYSQDSTHTAKCSSKCLKCSRMGFGPCPSESCPPILCEKCHQFFFNKDCFDLHSKNGTCSRYKKCSSCDQVYQKKSGKHVCGEKYCKTCHVFHLPRRGCFIEPIKQKEDKNSIIMAFDFETTQDTLVSEGVTEHVVNAVSARWCCCICAGKGQIDSDEPCDFCIPLGDSKAMNEENFSRSRYWSMYTSKDPLEAFISWLLKAFVKSQNVIVYSHNGGRFDNHFLLRSFYTRKLAPKLIMTGNKIYQMKIKHNKKYASLTFRDSYLLMQVPLDNLNKTFGLKSQPKPFFPYLFNSKANMHKKLDCLPPPEDYIMNSMMPSKREKFLEWYEKNKNTPFCLKSSLKEYVENDTAILLEAIIKMREILISITKGYDPFINSCTIAGIAMKSFRTLFLKPEQIAIVPEQGYERTDRASDLALKMLEWLAKKEKISIDHAGNGREKTYRLYDIVSDKSTTAKVDGYVKSQDRAIEILGCYYHGCPKHTKPNTIGANGKLSVDNYNFTMHRLELLKQQVSQIDIHWECEIGEALAKDKEMKDFFTDCNTQGRIEPRDAYFGGLTCAFKMKEKADESHELSLFDIVSLYPYCNYTGPYPLGHPDIIIPEEKAVDWRKPEDVTYKGIIKARIIPPRGLYIPQIPLRIPGDDRLLFCLCVPCAKQLKEKNKKQFDSYNCPHSERERAFTTTLSDIELKEALMHGYRVTHVYRAWNYPHWSNDIFRGYVQLLMKLKVENSEFPEGVSTDEEKQRFAQEYKDKLGIVIDVSKVGLNPGLRFISKILLNSLWGKFSQRNSLCKTSVINKRADFYSLLYDKRLEISQIIPMNQDTIRVTYRNKTDFVDENETSNIVVSLFTTSIARLKLFSYLRMIERNPGCTILYVDTDSVLFKHPRGLQVLPLGQFLGEMTKEYGDYDIIEFVAGGPKQYALMLRHKITGEIKYVIKLRGITLNHENAQRLQYEHFKSMVEKFGSESEEIIECEYNRLGPEQSSKILTKKLTKKYKVVNNKGLISSDYTLYPFGYK